MACDRIKPQERSKENNYKKVSCSFCNSKNTIKWCKRRTNRGLIQRYKCKDCNKHFTIDDGFYRMRNSSHKITLCLDLFFKGVSTREIQQHLQAFYPKNSSHVSIYKWIVRYSNLISNYTNNLKLNTGVELEIDEIEYKRRKQHNKKGTEVNYFIDTIDTKTRFMVNSKYVKSRDSEELKSFFITIKNKTDNVNTITTDGLTAYKNIVKKSFGYDKKLRKYNINHKVVNASAGEGFNHKIERLHNSIRHRTKTFRGFHGSLESANSIMKGYEIYYNFIRKHQAINKCPYELTTDIKLNENNKWLELIQLSSDNK